MRDIFVWACLLHVALADVYLLSPRASNNRLDEPSRDRSNARRLFDSQNNNRGGVNVGTFGRPYYYEGSVLPIEWTNQHSCGTDNANCDIIIQAYCDANVTRDGLERQTIPLATWTRSGADPNRDDCLNDDCDADFRFGRHESLHSYQLCRWRERNKGLWIGTQKLRGDGAIYTRQNANGDRYGYECPEERDYYPYWHPTEWRDVAVFTDDVRRCSAWQAESQNVKSRYYCNVTEEWLGAKLKSNGGQTGFIPITRERCEAAEVGGKWVEVPAFGVPAPDCYAAPWTRDNHLGSTLGGFAAGFNWTIPMHLIGESCVLRIRYNVTSSETRDNGDYLAPDSVQAGNLTEKQNYIVRKLPLGVKEDDNDPTAFRFAAELDVWTKFRLSRSEVAASLDPNLFGNQTRGYVMSNNPRVDLFGPLVATSFALQLNVATDEYGRTFQDRSHVFSIIPRPKALAGRVIHNLLVRGKRGNIVQTFPSTEYDFVPTRLYVNKGDLIHFQWTGSNTNPNNNAGQGTQGTDRSNIVLTAALGNVYDPRVELQPPPPGHYGSMSNSYPARIDDPTAPFLGLSTDWKRALALAGIYTPHVDVGPLQATRPGVYNYMSTRNHAFTNRGQKGQIVVLDHGEQITPLEMTYGRTVSASGKAWLRFHPDPLRVTTGSQLVLEEASGGRIQVSPPLFDVAPGQQVLLELRYDDLPLRSPVVKHSDFPDGRDEYTVSGSKASGGIVSFPITRGGYYRVTNDVLVGPIVGISIGASIAIGGLAFVYWSIRKKYRFGKPPTLEEGAQLVSPAV